MIHSKGGTVRAGFLAVMVLSSAAGLADAAVTIATDGKTVAKIVLAADANASEREAAEELRVWLKDMIGSAPKVVSAEKLPVDGAVNVGLLKRFGGPVEGVADQEVRIDCDGRRVIVAGGGDLGTIYAAIELLRHLGCRRPLANQRVIPRRPTIRLGVLSLRRRPAIRYRLLWRKDHWVGRNVLAGPRPFRYSKGHAMGRTLAPAKAHFARHPQWYALVKGARTAPQLCLSNPGVLAQCVRDVEKLCEPARIDVIGLSPADGYGFCECAGCTALGERLSDRIIWFENQIIRRVEKRYPRQQFFTFAYTPYEKPPLRNRPHPKLHVMYAPFVTFQDHPYGAGKSARNDQTLRNMEAWARLAPGRMMIFEYGPYNQCAPRANLFKVCADFRTFQRLGVMYFYRDMGRVNRWTHGINLYADGRLAWDPQLTSKQIIHDFCSLFGPAQATCAAFYQVQEEAMAAAHKVAYNVAKDLPRIYTPEVLAKCRRLLDQAHGEAAADATAAERVRILDRAFTYTELRVNQIRAYAAWQESPTEANRMGGLKVSNALFSHLKRCGGVIDLKRARRYCGEIRNQFSSTIHGIAPGKFSYVDQYDDGNTRIHMDALKQAGCFVAGPLLAHRPKQPSELIYEITTQRGCTFRELRFHLWQLGFPGAPKMKVELVTADGRRHVLFDGTHHRKWHAYDVSRHVAGSSSCRLRITRQNPSDQVQQFLGALRIEGRVDH